MMKKKREGTASRADAQKSNPGGPDKATEAHPTQGQKEDKWEKAGTPVLG